jgi:hypothetical protein
MSVDTKVLRRIIQHSGHPINQDLRADRSSNRRINRAGSGTDTRSVISVSLLWHVLVGRTKDEQHNLEFSEILHLPSGVRTGSKETGIEEADTLLILGS